MTIGDCVYYMSNGNLCSGQVVAACKSNYVVANGDSFRVFATGNSWERLYLSASEAVADGMAAAQKDMTSAMETIRRLAEQLARINNPIDPA